MIAHVLALMLALVGHLAPAPATESDSAGHGRQHPALASSAPTPAPASVPDAAQLVDEPPAVSDVPADWDGPATDSPMCTPPDVDPAQVDCWTPAGA